MHVHTCGDDPTAVEDGVPLFTRLYLSPPVPNLAGGHVTLRHGLDQAGTADNSG